MIVKSGREYIIENGFNTDSITKIIFGDSDSVSKENDGMDQLGSEVFTLEINNGFTVVKENMSFIFNITIPKNEDETKNKDPKKISCIGLFNNDTLIARIVFPPIYKKNNTELDLKYTLYF